MIGQNQQNLHTMPDFFTDFISISAMPLLQKFNCELIPFLSVQEQEDISDAASNEPNLSLQRWILFQTLALLLDL